MTFAFTLTMDVEDGQGVMDAAFNAIENDGYMPSCPGFNGMFSNDAVTDWEVDMHGERGEIVVETDGEIVTETDGELPA